MTSGEVYCYCGRILVYANSKSVIAGTAQHEATVRLAHDPCFPTCERTELKKGIWHHVREQQARDKAKEALRMSMKKGYTSIFDRWTRRDVCRASQLNIGWTEEQAKQMDQLALEDHAYHATKEERERYTQLGWRHATRQKLMSSRLRRSYSRKTRSVSYTSALPNIPRPKQQQQPSQQQQGHRVRLQEIPDSDPAGRDHMRDETWQSWWIDNK